jgi:hypothetical protein
MTSKKGLSEAEKRIRMSEIFLSVHYPPMHRAPSNMGLGRVLHVQGDRENRNSAKKDCPAERQGNLAISC